MHQEAFPGEDISDRPPPEQSVPGLLALIEGDLPSGRYSARRARGGARVSAALASRCRRALEAAEPPEARGLARDEVRLMVARGGEPLVHARLPSTCRGSCAPGDLLVVNESATLPAALKASARTARGSTLHLSTPEPPARLRAAALSAGSSSCGATASASAARRAGERLALAGGGRVVLVAPYLSAGRLWVARLLLPAPLLDYLDEHGAPIRYAHQPRDWPLGRPPDDLLPRARAAPRCRAPAGRSRPRVLARLAAAASASRR